jgi:hypothetical protein
VASTDKQNFRYPGEEWKQAGEKCQAMRDAGYDIDMTKLLTREVDQFRNESTATTVKRLGLVRSSAPVKLYRRPTARPAVSE